MLVIQRLVVELGEENFVIRYYNAREGGGGPDCIPEVTVGLFGGHPGFSVSVQPCP